MSAVRPAPARDIAALTGIRGVAAWAVVLYHVRLSLTDLLPAWMIRALGEGYLAVDLFFALSGFVIWLNYAEAVAGGRPRAAGRFLWRRVARVWPLHLAIMAAFVAFALILLVTGRDASAYPFAELPLHLLLIQNWGFTDALTWNDPAWSISTEFAAYLAFPFLAAAAARMPRLADVWLLAMAAILCVALWLFFAWHDEGSLGADIAHLGLWRCLAGFTLGCIACALWRRGAGTAGGWAGCAVGWTLGALALGWRETAIVPFATFAMLLALAFDRGPVTRWLASRPVLWLGRISYSTYLAHVLLFTLFKIAFVGDDLQIGWLGLGGYLALVLAASAALHAWVERPAQAALNRWADRPRAPLAQPSA